MRRPALAAAVLLGVAPPLAAEFTVLTVDNRTLPASSFTRGAMDTLSFSHAPWMHANLPLEDIVEIAAAGTPARPSAPAPLRVLLTNGDVLAGAATAAEADLLALASPSLGPLKIPFDQVDAVLAVAQQKYLPPARPETTGADLLVRAGGDRITGLLKSLDAERVVFEVDGKTVTVPARDLAGVYLTRVKEPPVAPTSLLVTAAARDGSSFTGALEEASTQGLRLRTVWPEPGQETPRSLRLPLAELVFLYVRNGRCVYLSDLAPSKVEERALVEPVAAAPGDPLAAFPFPWQKDRSVDPAQPRPLTLRGRIFRKGLGVHSYCALAYDLGARYKRFFATAGVDDATAGRGPEGRGGSVVFEAWVDGRKVFNSGTVTVRDEPCEIDLPVEGAKELRLVVDYGENYDLLDHADWAGARLIR
jgi:hypothetical protein